MSEPKSDVLRRWLSVRGYGLFTSALFRAHADPLRMRATFEKVGLTSREALLAKYPNLRFGDHQADELQLESITAVSDPSCVVLYLHGGAFFMGSPASYRRRTMKMSYRCNAEVFVPRYRLAPEHPFPAAIHDALRAWDYVAACRPNTPILLAGDSAGGGLVISLLVALRDTGRALPAGAIAFSPWVDHTHSGASVDGNAKRDRWLTRSHLEGWSRHVVGDNDPREPLLSPVFAPLHGLPPTLIFAGEHEILLDEARRLAEGMAAAGGDARLHVGRGMQHDWPLTLPWLAEAKTAWAEITEFAAEVCQAPMARQLRRAG